MQRWDRARRRDCQDRGHLTMTVTLLAEGDDTRFEIELAPAQHEPRAQRPRGVVSVADVQNGLHALETTRIVHAWLPGRANSGADREHDAGQHHPRAEADRAEAELALIRSESGDGQV